MSSEKELRDRSGDKCELCSSSDNLQIYEVLPKHNAPVNNDILICETCKEQINDSSKVEANHWRCLNDSMWSEVAAVQVVAWRMLNRLRSEGWPQDLLDMLYLEDDLLQWAKETGDDINEEDKVIHKDSNGIVLENGDTVVLTKDLNVKGGGFTAKRGTSVRNISLVDDNAAQIEGKISGQQIVILTQFVKKS